MNKIGTWYLDNNCHFCLWAPSAKSIQLKNIDTNEILSLNNNDSGYWSIKTSYPAGTKYKYIIDERNEFPDPVSFYQADGVHGPSQVFDHNSFKWTDESWSGLSLESMIIYELHTGTFTEAGDFLSICSKFEHLKELGINTIELMPIAQFPGQRNWGYDGVYPFAVQNSYGGPEKFKQFVDLCHNKGFAVILDVVYNHLGPEGNYLPCFGPYFTKKYNTPWGDAINFDDNLCEGVREYFINNALYWLEHFHIDALRLDAIHGIYDKSHKHILSELSAQVALFNQQHGRKCYLIAESDLNDSTNIRPLTDNGHGIDAQWNDDFHHALHTMLTNELSGYYIDFESIDTFIKAYNNNYVYDGIYSKFRNKIHGNNCSDLAPNKFVVFNQNHDQVGNRMLGERLISLSSILHAKIAAALTILSPSIPLLFMGEEYGEDSPFQYFIDHGDPDLVKAVQKGRANEFKEFMSDNIAPDPYSIETYNSSKLDWKKLKLEINMDMFQWYKSLILIRKTYPIFASSYKRDLKIEHNSLSNVFTITRTLNKQIAQIIFKADQQNSYMKIYIDDQELNLGDF